MKNNLLIFNMMMVLCLAVPMPLRAQNDDCRNLKNEIEKCLSVDNCAGAGALYDTYKDLCGKDNNIELRIKRCNNGNGKSKSKSTSAPSNKQTITVGSVSFDMVYVKGDTFTMGCTSEQGSDCDNDEYPAHSVTLSSYYIGETEVTQALWKAVMGNNPSYFKGDNLPVEQVSWDDAQAFVRELSHMTGHTFRLPTEAEWEYAARGGNKSLGSKYSGSESIYKVAWFSDNSDDKTHQVKTKSPNELGLYDMSGNVWEWCSDWYGSYSSSSQTNPKGPSSGTNRVNRGGSWFHGARICRASYRNHCSASFRYYYLGFRLVLVQ